MEATPRSNLILTVSATLLCLCVSCKPNSHLLAGKSYGVVDAPNAISANDLMQQSAYEAEQKFVGKIVTFKDLQATAVGEIDTSKNSCEVEFDATSTTGDKVNVQMIVNFNRTPDEVFQRISERDKIFGSSLASNYDLKLMKVNTLLQIKDKLCNRPEILECTTNRNADYGHCPFENGKFALSGRVFSVRSTSNSPMTIMITPTGFSSTN